MSIGILPNVNSIQTNWDVKLGISACVRIKNTKRRQECCGYCEHCMSDGLCLARLGVTGFSKRQTVPEKPDAKSLGTNSKNAIH